MSGGSEMLGLVSSSVILLFLNPVVAARSWASDTHPTILSSLSRPAIAFDQEAIAGFVTLSGRHRKSSRSSAQAVTRPTPDAGGLATVSRRWRTAAAGVVITLPNIASERVVGAMPGRTPSSPGEGDRVAEATASFIPSSFSESGAHVELPCRKVLIEGGETDRPDQWRAESTGGLMGWPRKLFRRHRRRQKRHRARIGERKLLGRQHDRARSQNSL